MKLVWGGVVFAALLLCSCQKEDIAVGPAGPAAVSFKGVLVVDQSDSGDLSLIQGDAVIPDVYEQQNASTLPSDLIDFQVAGDFGYALCGASGSIIVIDMLTLRKVDEITGLGSAKHLLMYNQDLAFVTSGTSEGILFKVDLNSRQIAGAAVIGPIPGAVAHAQGKLFVGCGSSWSPERGLWVVDAVFMQVIHTIPTELATSDMVADPNGNLWMLFKGYAANNGVCDDYTYYPAKLARLNPDTYETELFPVFGQTEMYPSHLCISPDGQQLFFAHDGICSIALDNPDARVLISELPVSGIDVNPTTGDIWFWKADQHTVGFMDSHGVLQQSYDAGINPVEVAFY